MDSEHSTRCRGCVNSPLSLGRPLGGQEFVAVWSGISVAKRGATARQVIRARRFRLGAPQGKEIDVNVARGGAPGMPPFLPSGLAVAAAFDDAGRLLLLWRPPIRSSRRCSTRPT